MKRHSTDKVGKKKRNRESTMNKNTKASRRPQRCSETLKRFRGKCVLSLKADEGAGMDRTKKKDVFWNTSGSDLFKSLHLSAEKHIGFQNLL